MPTERKPIKDADGVTHYVDKQDEPMSCALSCITMLWEQTRQQCMIYDEGHIKTTVSSQFPGDLLSSQLNGDNNGLGNGTTASNVASSLKKLGIPVTHTDTFKPAVGSYGFVWRKDKIKERRPAIILVGWYTSPDGKTLKRNGGHFIVADRVTSKGLVVVLDPGTGTLHHLGGSQGLYLNHGLRGKMQIIHYTG